MPKYCFLSLMLLGCLPWALGCGGQSPPLGDTEASDPDSDPGSDTEDTDTDSFDPCPWGCLTQKGCDAAGGEVRAGYECDYPSQLCCQLGDPDTGGTETHTASTDATDPVDTITQTDEPCPYVCENWQTCTQHGGTVEPSFSCANAAFVCCDDPQSTDVPSDSASETSSSTVAECPFTCRNPLICASLGGLDRSEDYPSCKGLFVCCEVPEDTDTAPNGAAVSFDGASYLQVDSSAAINLSGSQWTIEAWVTAYDIGAVGTQPVLRKGGASAIRAPYYLYALSWDSTNYQLEGPYGGFVYDSTGSYYSVSQSAAVSLDEWHHLALVHNGTSLRLFVDGALAHEYATSGEAVYDVWDYLYIGANLYSGTYLRGAVDEVRISGTARYSGGFTPATRLGVDASTEALWHFDEGSGSVAYDEVSDLAARFGGAPEWIAGVY